MTNQTQYGRTLLLKSLDDDSLVSLRRLQFVQNSTTGADYDEAWLQRLIAAEPRVLPIEQIESVITNLVSICTELPVAGVGSLDNLFMTPDGHLVLMECKLWRNPEARRKVVAQILDYASEMSRWSYEDLQTAVARSSSIVNQRKEQDLNLYNLVAEGKGVEEVLNEFEEQEFADKVSRNLRLGRFLLLLVGDGIKENVETLTGFVQQHAGLHFTLGLVELAILKMPDRGFLVQPRVLARTTNINRGIVTIEDDRVRVRADATDHTPMDAPSRRVTLTKEAFLERLEQTLPRITPKLNNFIDKLSQVAVNAEFGSSTLILRWYADSGRAWNYGIISMTGEVWMDALIGRAKAEGITPICARYMEQLAQSAPGATVKYKHEVPSVIHLNGKTIKIDSLLADETHMDAWIKAIEQLQEEIAAVSSS